MKYCIDILFKRLKVDLYTQDWDRYSLGHLHRNYMFVTIHIWSVEAFDNSKSANCTCANFLMPGNKCLKPYRETHIVIPEQESIEHLYLLQLG